MVTRKAMSGGMVFLHIVLTIITIGLWLAFWLVHGAARAGGTYRCTVCGTKIKPGATAPPEERDKQCPQCAETVKVGAAVCRYCGHDFTALAIPAREQGKKAS